MRVGGRVLIGTERLDEIEMVNNRKEYVLELRFYFFIRNFFNIRTLF